MLARILPKISVYNHSINVLTEKRMIVTIIEKKTVDVKGLEVIFIWN
jgi:hypothetical protein